MKISTAVIIGLLSLATAACESGPANSGDLSPNSFKGDLNDLGGHPLPAPQNVPGGG